MSISKSGVISSAMSAKPEKVKVFQFGHHGLQIEDFTFDSSSKQYDSEMETEFNRMKDGGSSFGLSISHMKLEINMNHKPNKSAEKRGNLHNSARLRH